VQLLPRNLTESVQLEAAVQVITAFSSCAVKKRRTLILDARGQHQRGVTPDDISVSLLSLVRICFVHDSLPRPSFVASSGTPPCTTSSHESHNGSMEVLIMSQTLSQTSLRYA